MDVTIIGSGTVVPVPDRVCSAYHVRVGPNRILLDCGPGSLHHFARFGVAWDRLTHVALTHFHTDHTGGLPILLFALRHALAEPRREALTILGPQGTAALLRRLAAAFGDYITDPGFPVSCIELEGGRQLALGGDVVLGARTTPHTAASIAYRIDAPDGSLGYTGDTGPDDGLGDFFRDVDTLIAECSLPDEMAIDVHLSPTRVAALAGRAQPRLLVATHVYPLLLDRDPTGLIRRAGWNGDLVLARDGMRLVVGAAPPAD